MALLYSTIPSVTSKDPRVSARGVYLVTGGKVVDETVRGCTIGYETAITCDSPKSTTKTISLFIFHKQSGAVPKPCKDGSAVYASAGYLVLSKGDGALSLHFNSANVKTEEGSLAASHGVPGLGEVMCSFMGAICQILTRGVDDGRLGGLLRYDVELMRGAGAPAFFVM